MGRIALLLRTDMYAQRQSLLYALGTLFLVLFVIPRIPILTTAVSWSEWCSTVSASPMSWAMWQLSVCGIFGTLTSLIYINRRVQHAYPIPFALLPARLGEKVTAIGLFALGLYFSPFVVFALSEGLTALTFDGDYTSVLSISGLRANIQEFFSALALRPASLLPMALLQLAYLLSFIFSAIRFARLRVGIFVTLMGWLLGVMVLITIGAYLIRSEQLVEFFDMLKGDTAMLLTTAFLLLLNTILAYAIYHRVKTIEL